MFSQNDSYNRSAAGELRRAAAHFARQFEAQSEETLREIGNLERRLAEANKKLDNQANAQQRLTVFEANADRCLCPYCWIVEGSSNPLEPMRFDDPDDDVLRCHQCGRDYGVRFPVNRSLG
jgi:hypothetical protein